MLQARTPWLATFVVLLGLAGTAYAAAESLTNRLIVRHVITRPDGQEMREPAASGRPGDVLEYVVAFHNGGSSTARNLSATLPLPAGTEFVLGSQQPSAASGSVDGVAFNPLPLRRTVKQADGASHDELVPAGEYRALRWAASDLLPSADMSVSARVIIASR